MGEVETSSVAGGSGGGGCLLRDGCGRRGVSQEAPRGCLNLGKTISASEEEEEKQLVRHLDQSVRLNRETIFERSRASGTPYTASSQLGEVGEISPPSGFA